MLAAALWLCVACKRAPDKFPAAPTPDLPPPSPSSSFVITPLDTASTVYTNEMQVANLREETSKMGIQNIGKRSEERELKERMEQLRGMTREFARARRGIDGARDKSVALPGNTAALINWTEFSGSSSGAVQKKSPYPGPP